MVMRELIPPITQKSLNQFTSPSSDEEQSNFPPESVFWFLDEDYPSSGSSSSTGLSGEASRDNDFTCAASDNFYHDEEADARNFEANKSFWEEQEQLLQAILYRKTSIESKIRTATRDAIRQSKKKLSSTEFLSTASCITCGISGCCRSCMRREVSTHLRESGYACSIKESKWKSSAELPAGEHVYLEILAEKETKSKLSLKKEGLSENQTMMRVIIELNFKAEFEMGKGSEDYNRLISLLPEVFVGKSEKMKSLVKILCGAAKRCVMDRGMHLGPWRKEKYVKSKWELTRSTGGTSSAVVSAAAYESVTTGVGFGLGLVRGDALLPCKERLQSAVKPRSSLLTFALIHNLPVAVTAAGWSHRQTVAVL